MKYVPTPAAAPTTRPPIPEPTTAVVSPMGFVGMIVPLIIKKDKTIFLDVIIKRSLDFNIACNFYVSIWLCQGLLQQFIFCLLLAIFFFTLLTHFFIFLIHFCLKHLFFVLSLT